MYHGLNEFTVHYADQANPRESPISIYRKVMKKTFYDRKHDWNSIW